MGDCYREITTSALAVELWTSDKDASTVYAGTTTIDYSTRAFASALRVAWKSADLPLFTPKSAPLIQFQNLVPLSSEVYTLPSNVLTTPPPISTTARNIPSTSTTSQLLNVDTPCQNCKKSNTLVLGLEIGVPIAALTVVGVLIWLLLRRRSKSKLSG